MKLSIIIPIFNEIDKIEMLLSNIANIKGDFEVLFADGGSEDGTLLAIGKEYRIIHSEKGRAIQMNTAAKQSSGDVLLFLHCDSLLPEDALTEIEGILDKGFDVGCFRLRFSSKHILMKCCGVLSNLRVKYRHIAFGDQGIFLRREVFEKVGGFEDLPLMEDYKLSMILKGRYKIGQTNGKITTSDRRFIKGGILSTMLKMQRLQYMFRKGVDINIIASMYRD